MRLLAGTHTTGAVYITETMRASLLKVCQLTGLRGVGIPGINVIRSGGDDCLYIFKIYLCAFGFNSQVMKFQLLCCSSNVAF